MCNCCILTEQQPRPFLAEVDATATGVSALCLVHEVLDLVIAGQPPLMVVLILGEGDSRVLDELAELTLGDRLQVGWINI